MNKQRFDSRVSKHRRKTKQRLVDLFGGKCQICGYNKCLRSLQFHHIDPSKKLYHLAKNTSVISFYKLAEEAKKCILVCANCHGEIEDETTAISNVVLQQLKDIHIVLSEAQNKHKEARKGKKIKCLTCGKIVLKGGREKYCSNLCGDVGRRKSTRPSKEVLNNLLWTMPTTSIAKMYTVSDKAITKWAKSMDLSKPARGYWSKNGRKC